MWISLPRYFTYPFSIHSRYRLRFSGFVMHSALSWSGTPSQISFQYSLQDTALREQGQFEYPPGHTEDTACPRSTPATHKTAFPTTARLYPHGTGGSGRPAFHAIADQHLCAELNQRSVFRQLTEQQPCSFLPTAQEGFDGLLVRVKCGVAQIVFTPAEAAISTCFNEVARPSLPWSQSGRIWAW